MRFTPEVRALCERARKPALRILVGGALMAPAAVLMAGGRLAELEQPRTMASTEILTEPVTEAEGQRLRAHEQELIAASFAQEFDIPLQLAKSIHEAAVEADIVPRVAFGLVKAESSFRTQVRSPVGAVGLTQLMPATARWLVPGTTRSELEDPETNLRIGFTYLRQLIDKFEGDEKLALTAYNRGPGTVNRLISRGANPDNGYADKVLTGESDRHVALMNAKFGGKTRRGT